MSHYLYLSRLLIKHNDEIDHRSSMRTGVHLRLFQSAIHSTTIGGRIGVLNDVSKTHFVNWTDDWAQSKRISDLYEQLEVLLGGFRQVSGVPEVRSVFHTWIKNSIK